MYTPMLDDVRLHRILLELDEKTAAEVKAQGCTRADCDGKLHSARYRRKPRGLPGARSDCECWRQSFCCAKEGCRGRTTPASLIFLGRKVYLAVVVTLITAMRCGLTPERMQRLKELVGVSRQTVRRWERWWRELMPKMPFWRSACAAFSAPVDTGALPLSLLERFTGEAEERLVACMRFLAPLTGGAGGAKKP
jgi:DNA-binding XRE family transcriptional regulator